MSRLIRYLLIVSAVALLISYVTFLFLNVGLRNQKNDTFPVINELVTSNVNYQVLFVGSSLAKNNINPLVFDSITSLNSYNFGYPAAKIDHSQMIINRYLHSNHPTPKQIFLMMEPYVLDSTIEVNFPVQYYPYANDSIIYHFISKYDEDIKVIKYFPFIGVTKYNDYLKNLGLTGVLFNNRVTSKLIKGYEPLDANTWRKNQTVIKDEQIDLSVHEVTGFVKKQDYGLKCLETIFQQCKEKGIKLYLVFPPIFQSSTVNSPSSEKFIEILAPITERYKVIVLNHSTIDLCKRKDFFFDDHHLNRNGATHYTRLLAHSFKKE